MSAERAEDQRARSALLLAFFACYVVSAVVLQATNRVPPWEDQSPLDYFTGGLLWMLSVVSLLHAESAWQRRGERWGETWFWMAASAALAVLAMDEYFAVHERTESVGIEDEIVKVPAWIASAFVLGFIVRWYRPGRAVVLAFVVGYVFHSLHTTVDTGDGDFFRIPLLSLEQLRWSEEVFELLFLTCYALGFLHLLLARR